VTKKTETAKEPRKNEPKNHLPHPPKSTDGRHKPKERDGQQINKIWDDKRAGENERKKQGKQNARSRAEDGRELHTDNRVESKSARNLSKEADYESKQISSAPAIPEKSPWR
jgi:hypothetical protein